MGYETRIHVVKTYQKDGGIELATLELGNCGDGPVGTLVQKYTKEAKPGEKAPFYLYACSSDKSFEGGETIRKLSKRLKEKGKKFDGKNSYHYDKLAAEVEDGSISEDKYGCYLGVIPIDEFIQALEQNIQKDGYKRFVWALLLLVSIRDSFKDGSGSLKVITYGH